MKTNFIKLARKFAGLLVVVALGACAIQPSVRASFDSNTDFTRYRTFGFVTPLATDRSGYQSLVSQELKANTQRELESRGLRLDNANPQLLINFNAALTDKSRLSTMPVPLNNGLGYFGGNYYAYRGGIYSPWPYYVDQTVVFNYKEGTINIDVVDAARKQLVWEGIVTDSNVTQEELANLPESIKAAVSAAFAKFPLPPTKQ
jgi:Domain of unknown function (DUF4136)